MRVAEKEAVTDAQIAAGMDQTREELVNQRRDRFFSGYMPKAKETLKITINQETLARAIGPRTAQEGRRCCRRERGKTVTSYKLQVHKQRRQVAPLLRTPAA